MIAAMAMISMAFTWGSLMILMGTTPNPGVGYWYTFTEDGEYYLMDQTIRM